MGKEKQIKLIPLTDEERKRVQGYELKILIEIHRICTKYNIRYSLAYGTLIGAVRHHGFIPWDDDVDICMLREDYIKFKTICKKELGSAFFYQSQDTDPEYFYLFDKIRLNGTIFKESFVSKYNIHHGVYIDIFPVDFIPDNYFLRKFQYCCFQFFRIGVQAKYLMLNARTGVKRYIFGFLRLFYFFIPLRFLYKTANQIATWYDCKPCNRVMNFYTPYRTREIFNSQMYQKYIRTVFENEEFCIVRDYDLFLHQIYGNYMELPPKDQRCTRHTITELKL